MTTTIESIATYLIRAIILSVVAVALILLILTILRFLKVRAQSKLHRQVADHQLKLLDKREKLETERLKALKMNIELVKNQRDTINQLLGGAPIPAPTPTIPTPTATTAPTPTPTTPILPTKTPTTDPVAE